MNPTPIELIRQASATRGGLARATDAQKRRWWMSLDNVSQAELLKRFAPPASNPDKPRKKSAGTVPAEQSETPPPSEEPVSSNPVA